MRIAVVGATGEVGREMLRQLELQDVRGEVRAFASARSAGKKLPWRGGELTVELLDEVWPFDGVFDYVLLAAGGELSKRFAPRAAAAKATVIDNSSAWRGDPAVPLVVPKVNGGLLQGYRGIVANPNCSTIQLVLSLSEVYRRWGIKEIVVSTYQAVSGSGHRGIEELLAQEKGATEHKKFPAQIWRNVIPQIGGEGKDGFCEEEVKMIVEPRKIFGDGSIECWPTTVRVPVMYGHSESVFCRTARPFENLEEVREAMRQSPNVVWEDGLLTPLTHAPESDATFVGRLRSCGAGAFSFWNVANNIRVGAATNAVRILRRHAELNGAAK